MNQFAVTTKVVEEIKAYKAKVEAMELKPVKNPTKEEFTFLLSGISSLRIMPGIDKHMGYESMYQCDEQDAKRAREHLAEIYHISDEASLDTTLRTYYHSHDEYLNFLGFYRNESTYQVSDLDERVQEVFTKCMNYAELFYPIVENQGFLAWDVNEIIGMCRKAYACGIIDEAGFFKRTNPLVDKVQQVFTNWKDYAISLLCGAIYFNYRQTFKEEQAQQIFKLQRNLIDGLLLNHGAYAVYSFKMIKNFYLDMTKLQNLLPNWEGAQGCIATDRILVDGIKVGYMYREAPQGEWDSGWRFLAGDETQAYLDTRDNVGVYSLNTLCNYDQDIMGFLDEEEGSIFVRREDHLLHKIK